MKLTKQTDFALRTLLFLAQQKQDQRFSVQQIADTYEIPHNHLTKIVNKLSNLGYIKTFRGRNGGIILGKPQNEIFIRQIIVDFEPSLNPADCGNCVLAKNCVLKIELASASEAFLAALDGKTLADIM